VNLPGGPGALWMAGQLPVHWVVHGPWSVTVRPSSPGTATAAGSPVNSGPINPSRRWRRRSNTACRTERRKGFFDSNIDTTIPAARPAVSSTTRRRRRHVGLTSGQHLVAVGFGATFDSAARW